MQVRSRRQPSFSSQRDMGSEAKRAKSKLSSHGLKRESEEDLRPRVLFRANKEEVQTGKTRKNNKNEARKTSMDKVLERIAEKSTKNTCKGSQLMLSSSHIAQK
jgi:hypothetical protein